MDSDFEMRKLNFQFQKKKERKKKGGQTVEDKLTWLDMQGSYCLSDRTTLIQGHGSECPLLFAPVLSFLQPFHDLSTLAREAPGQSVAVKGKRQSKAEGG